jgi:hypothetical protein
MVRKTELKFTLAREELPWLRRKKRKRKPQNVKLQKNARSVKLAKV